MANSKSTLLENPFPGLRPYRESESGNFFGQDEQIDRLLEGLGDSRFLAVVGISGSGKSSLVRAGLIAALKGGSDAADSRWRVASCRPGADPLLNMAAALDKTLGFKESRALPLLRRSARGVVDMVNSAGLDSGQRLLLLVDQFEELFRYRRTDSNLNREDEAAHFVRLLLEAASDEVTNIYIVITMRSDFIGDCALFYGLAERINEGLYLVPKMQRRQLREVIEEPLRDRGIAVEPALVERLLKESEEREDGLPLLQHALMRIWRRWAKRGAPGSLIRERDFLLWRSPAKMRPMVEQHLDRHLGSIYRSLSPARRACAENLFQLLSERDSRGREVRRGVRFEDLCRLLNVPSAELLCIIDAFRNEGAGRTFLMPLKGETSPTDPIDISHECLLRQWTMLKLWIREEASNASQFQALADRAASGGNLLPHKDLRIVAGWWETRSPTPEWASRYERPADASLGIGIRSYEQARTYLKASQDAAKSKRLFRQLLVAAVVMSLLIAGAYGLLSITSDARDSVARAKTEVADAKAGVQAAQTAYAAVQREIPAEVKGTKARNPASLQPRLYTQCWSPEQWQRVLPLKPKLQDAGFLVPKWEKVSVGPDSNEVRYFHKADLDKATKIQTILGADLPVKVSYVAGFENSTDTRPGHFELWIAKPHAP
jgi:hypothetical protein